MKGVEERSCLGCRHGRQTQRSGFRCRKLPEGIRDRQAKIWITHPEQYACPEWEARDE